MQTKALSRLSGLGKSRSLRDVAYCNLLDYCVVRTVIEDERSDLVLVRLPSGKASIMLYSEPGARKDCWDFKQFEEARESYLSVVVGFLGGVA